MNRGARLTLPRDLQVVYFVARLGVVTIADCSAIFWGSPHTARSGFGRLVRLGLLRTFSRRDPSHPNWFALTPEGREWLVEQGCDEGELRVVHGVGRLNLGALAMRNRFWASLILASRRHRIAKVLLFQSEAELRRLKEPHVPVVPDALVVIGEENEATTSVAWMVELDLGSERSAIWVKKAADYAQLRARGALYGIGVWQVLALVPTKRRAESVAAAVERGGAGEFTFLGIASEFESGLAFDRRLWLARELAGLSDALPTATLLDPVLARDNPDQRPRSTVDRGGWLQSGAKS